MRLEIVEYPDKRLKEISKKVEVFDEKLHIFLDLMYQKMLESNGIGLAAIQVANPIRVLIINIPNENDEQSKENLLEIINPEFISQDGSTIYQEGCLSVPKFYEDVERFDSVVVLYNDRFGNQKTLQAEGLLSVALQHEIDHLNGVLFIDRLSYSRRKKFEKEYKKAQKDKKNSKK